MTKERYPGERRGLSLFLQDLLSPVERQCGQRSILLHAIRRALRSGDLHHLRHARKIFNHLSREQRGRLTAAIVAHGGSATPASHELLDAYSRRQPASFVSFESASDAPGEKPASATLTHELLPPSPVRVMVSPGTLPSTAANSLRHIAGMIESDRRLLSERYWRARAEEPAPPGEDQRDRR